MRDQGLNVGMIVLNVAPSLSGSDILIRKFSLSLSQTHSLRLFQKFDTFRILVCGGDGSVGWVLSEIDTLTLHKQVSLSLSLSSSIHFSLVS